MDTIETTLGLCYYDHFVHYLSHEPKDHDIFCPEGDTSPCLHILGFDSIFGGCRAFCSLGLTLYEQQVFSLAEVVMPVNGAWDSTPYLLANTLFFIAQHKMPLRRGLVIGGIGSLRPEFTAEFAKEAIYFAEPFGFPEGFNQLKCDNKTGDVYLASFISEAEQRFLRHNGVERFETLLEEQHVDVFNVHRSSCV